MIYFAFVHSHLAYSVEIYGNTNVDHHNGLMILNNILLQILQNPTRDTPVVKLHANFNTLTLPELHTYQILKFVHNCNYHQNKLPSIFSNYFTQNYMLQIYNTHSREHLHLEQTVPWSTDLSNLKKVVCGTLSQMNSSLSELSTVPPFAKLFLTFNSILCSSCDVCVVS